MNFHRLNNFQNFRRIASNERTNVTTIDDLSFLFQFRFSKQESQTCQNIFRRTPQSEHKPPPSSTKQFMKVHLALLSLLTGDIIQWNQQGHGAKAVVDAFSILPHPFRTKSLVSSSVVLRAENEGTNYLGNFTRRVLPSGYNIGPQGYSIGFRDEEDRKAKEWLRKERIRERNEDGYADMFRKKNTLLRKFTKPLRMIRRNILAPKEPGKFHR